MPFARQRFHYGPIIERSALLSYLADLDMEGLVEQARWKRGPQISFCRSRIYLPDVNA